MRSKVSQRAGHNVFGVCCLQDMQIVDLECINGEVMNRDFSISQVYSSVSRSVYHSLIAKCLDQCFVQCLIQCFVQWPAQSVAGSSLYTRLLTIIAYSSQPLSKFSVITTRIEGTVKRPHICSNLNAEPSVEKDTLRAR